MLRPLRSFIVVGYADSWTTIKDAILDSSSTPLHIETLFDYLRNQKDDPSAREVVQRSVDFQFLSQIMISYNATTSSIDKSIFDVMDLLENTYKVNMSVISPVVWGENSREIYRKRGQFGGTLSRTTPSEVLELLDGLRMWKTVLNHSRPLFDVDTGETSLIYDVRFLLRLFLSLMHPGSELPLFQLKYRSFVEFNGLSLAFSCTSSRIVSVRKLAYCVLQSFLSLLQELDVDAVEDRHKYLYIYLLRIFKQSIESVAPRLAHMVSHFFSRVSKLFLHPESPLFSPVLSFFSLKPVIDLNNVPELYKLLLSSSTDHHHQEREWILTLISEGLIEPMDYNLLQNRSGVKLMLSLFPTCMLDMASRRLILTILKSAVQMPSVAHDLFYRMNLHSWIASIITDSSISTWERCYLGQIYSILIEIERKHCRRSADISEQAYSVAYASVKITSRVVLLAMSPLNDKPTAVENIKAIQSTVEAKWHPKQRLCTS
uniref:NopRA1 domain-containing protein n=1 Tax=Angiostrongylus cantonensis TaxID=6313 RepID=A0A158P9P7_ANGCA